MLDGIAPRPLPQESRLQGREWTNAYGMSTPILVDELFIILMIHFWVQHYCVRYGKENALKMLIKLGHELQYSDRLVSHRHY